MSGSLDQVFAKLVLGLVPMLLSLSVHEFAHAWSAKKLGDDTAESMGRLTLNPVAHIDVFGTLLLPALLMLQGMGFFGWAKPVPVNPTRFSRKISMRTGMMLTAAAGPLSNLVLAFVCAGVISILVHSGAIYDAPEAVRSLLVQLLQVNIGLFVFNMIPVGPLDGQKVLGGFLSGPTAVQWERFNFRFGYMALAAIVILAPQFIGVPITLVFNGIVSVVGLS